MPLDTSWISWFILLTVASWLAITQKLRVQVSRDRADEKTVSQAVEVDCERFPDQCPCTTEFGKGVA
jgi:hypothetical protein